MRFFVTFFGIFVALLGPACQSVENVTVDELQKMLEEEQTPLLLDVRLVDDFDEAPQMIASAKWHNPTLVDEWGDELPKDREVIVYCVHGHLISKRAAARLRELGLDARILEGGIEAWKESGREVIPAKRD